LLAPIDASAEPDTAWETVIELSKAGSTLVPVSVVLKALIVNSGDGANVDLLVGDIYGEEDDKYARLGLNKDVIASRYLSQLCVLLFLFTRRHSNDILVTLLCF
jgi:hypothetical protein